MQIDDEDIAMAHEDENTAATFAALVEVARAADSASNRLKDCGGFLTELRASLSQPETAGGWEMRTRIQKFRAFNGMRAESHSLRGNGEERR